MLKRRSLKLIFCIAGVVFALLTHLLPPAWSQQSISVPAIPTIVYQGARIPDWQRITFATLPRLTSGGSFTIPPQLVAQFGFNPSRSWRAGDSITQVLSLLDLQDSFGIEQFSVRQLLGMMGGSFGQFRLSDLGLTRWQSIAGLVNAIPGLGNLSVSQVVPIADLLRARGFNFSTERLADIAVDRVLGNLRLGEINLDRYALTAIPGITNVALQNFQNWQLSLINQVPGLSQIPLSSFPRFAQAAQGVVAMMDMPYGTAEARRINTISGSNPEESGFRPFPCNQRSCAYIELTDPPGFPRSPIGSLHGKQWIAGTSQNVPGGLNLPLNRVNNGREPTGRHPFGGTFKIVLTRVTESQGLAEFQAYGRVCIPVPVVGRSCTPYFIPLFPWFPSREKDLIFVGLL